MSSSDFNDKTVIDIPPPMYQGYNESSSSTNPAYPGPTSSPGYPGPPPAYSGTAPGKQSNVDFGQTSTRAVCGNCHREVRIFPR